MPHRNILIWEEGSIKDLRPIFVLLVFAIVVSQLAVGQAVSYRSLDTGANRTASALATANSLRESTVILPYDFHTPRALYDFRMLCPKSLVFAVVFHKSR